MQLRATFKQLSMIFGLAAIAAPCFAEKVTGTLTYQDTNGVRPIRYAKVEIWRYAPRVLFIWAWGKDAEATTDGAGVFYADVAFAGSGSIVAIRAFASNYAATVWPNDGAIIHTYPFYAEPPFRRTVTAPGDTALFNFNFADDYPAHHFNIAEAARIGHEYARARRDPREFDKIPVANIQPSSATITSWYNAPADTIVIHNDRRFNDFAVLHEYAHFLQAKIGRLAWIPATHDGCSATLAGTLVNSREHAWMEGFADFFARAVGQAFPAEGLQDGPNPTTTPTVSRLEADASVNPCTALGQSGVFGFITPEMIELRVAAALWDLADPQGGTYEPADGISGADGVIFQIMDHELGGPGNWPSILDFVRAWVARGLPLEPLEKILRQQNLPIPLKRYWNAMYSDSLDDVASKFGYQLVTNRVFVFPDYVPNMVPLKLYRRTSAMGMLISDTEYATVAARDTEYEVQRAGLTQIGTVGYASPVVDTTPTSTTFNCHLCEAVSIGSQTLVNIIGNVEKPGSLALVRNSTTGDYALEPGSSARIEAYAIKF